MANGETLDMLEVLEKLRVIRHAICESRVNDALQATRELEERLAEELKA